MGTSGARATVGIPGTGMYWTENLTPKTPRAPAAPTSSAPQPAPQPSPTPFAGPPSVVASEIESGDVSTMRHIDVADFVAKLNAVNATWRASRVYGSVVGLIGLAAYFLAPAATQPAVVLPAAIAAAIAALVGARRDAKRRHASRLQPRR